MQNKIKSLFAKYWLLILFVCVSIYIYVYDIAFIDISSNLSGLTVWQCGLLVIAAFVSMGIHILSRSYLLNMLGEKCTLKNLTYIYFSTLAANYSTPVKIGYPLAIYLLKKIENVSVSNAVAMLLIELVISTSICGFIAALSIGIFWEGAFESGNLYMFLLSVFCISILIILTGYLSKYISGNYVFNQVNKFISLLKNISPVHLLIYLLFMLALRFTDAFTLWLMTVFIAEPLSIWQTLIASSAAFFIGSISMVPMGIGTRDISLAFYLQHYGLNDSEVLIIITMQRILSTGLTFILGAIFGGLLGVKNLKDSNRLKDIV